MKGIIRFTELQVDKLDNGKKIVYPSLFDIFGKTKEDLAELVSILERNNIFNFANCGKYCDYDKKYKMHFTYDDGQEDLDWLLHMGRIVKLLRDYNNTDIMITLNKSDIIEQRDIVDLTADKLERIKCQEKVCDTYIAYLKAALRQHSDIESVFRIPAKGKIYKEVISGYDNNYLYLKE